MRTLALFLLLFIFYFKDVQAIADLTPNYLRCEYLVNPVTDVAQPRLSWILESDERAQLQTAYQILVASHPDLLDPEEADLWNSGKIISNQTNQVVYQGKPLASRTTCFWLIRSWDKEGNPGPWSRMARWEMGLLDADDWKGKWIGKDFMHQTKSIPFKGKELVLPPAPLLRKSIALTHPIEKARLYVTALGLYEFRINGDRVGNDYLAPGWTAYDKRVYYHTYDVADKLKQGQQVLQAHLSYGWFSGYIGYALLVGNPVVRAFYGDTPALKAQLEVIYTNGDTATFSTDETWKISQGGLQESDILHGETFDARKEPKDWHHTDFDDSDWEHARVIDVGKRNLQVYPAQPVQVTEEITPVSITHYKDHDIINMGQNFAGIVKLKVKGESGDKVIMKFGEMLLPDGSLMDENLRMARATDTYILSGDPDGEEWTPQFTYHGFQYVKIVGYPGTLSRESITGLVLGSNTPRASYFETDHKMVNQLYQNIIWTQRANFVDIPTDCPQRDERMGWTGDAQIYGGTSAINMDVAAFFTKWIQDLHDGQWDYGAYPDYAPAPAVRSTDTFAPGWMEAGVINPYEVYRAYGDTRIIEKGWENMEKFMAFHAERSKGKYFYPEGAFSDLNPKGGYGDWLSVGKKTPPDMLATFYYGYVAGLMAEMAEAIGKGERAKHYQDLSQNIKSAFAQHYMEPETGRLKTDTTAYGDGSGYVDGQMGFSGHTQTAYANAIYHSFLSGPEKALAGKHLATLIRENDGKLATGFLGVKQLLPALSATGNSELAYDLLLNTEYPSWGFEIENGATTIWERWDSYVIGDPEKMANLNAGMNSFSHYAFGSVFEWMFRNMAGIRPDAPAYKTFFIQPEIPKKDIRYLAASHQSIMGEIKSSWQLKEAQLHLKITVPVNTRAKVFFPTNNPNEVTVDGKKPAETRGLTVGEFRDGYLEVQVGSGDYELVGNYP